MECHSFGLSPNCEEIITVRTALNTGYNFQSNRSLSTASSTRDAIEISVWNYFRHQLGLSEEFCQTRTGLEVRREIPKAVLTQLRKFGWQLEGKRVLDVGAGQGGTILEFVEQGIDAYGVEPGREFATLARMRLSEAGHDPSRVITAIGQSMPFPDEFFDYVVSLQVLEHVPDPAVVLREIFRVLRPTGQCAISCDNYLAFREPHYRVFWLPLLPKKIGSFYLRMLGRDPTFLNRYIYYRTYPEVRRLCSVIGFEDVTFRGWIDRIENPDQIKTIHLKKVALLLPRFPKRIYTWILRDVMDCKNMFRSDVSFVLEKPNGNPRA